MALVIIEGIFHAEPVSSPQLSALVEGDGFSKKLDTGPEDGTIDSQHLLGSSRSNWTILLVGTSSRCLLTGDEHGARLTTKGWTRRFGIDRPDIIKYYISAAEDVLHEFDMFNGSRREKASCHTGPGLPVLIARDGKAGMSGNHLHQQRPQCSEEVADALVKRNVPPDEPADGLVITEGLERPLLPRNGQVRSWTISQRSLAL